MTETSSGPRILFAGTPEFAVPALQALIAEQFAPAAVLTQPDRPAGRGRQLQQSPVKKTALLHGIPVHQPTSLRSDESRDLVSRLAPDLMIVVAYGLILPEEILAIPRFGCWNIHASLLPRWRGAAPIQRAIEAGDSETGVCIMQMEKGLDTGPVIMESRLPLQGQETGGELHDSLARLGARALVECVHRVAEGEALTARPQSKSGVTYASKLEKAEARLCWYEAANLLERRVRAFNPWPVAWCMVGDERTRIWKAAVTGSPSRAEPGTVLASDSDGIDVATRDGVLRLLELQPPGKRRMSAGDYLNARELPPVLNGH